MNILVSPGQEDTINLKSSEVNTDPECLYL